MTCVWRSSAFVSFNQPHIAYLYLCILHVVVHVVTTYAFVFNDTQDQLLLATKGYWELQDLIYEYQVRS